jgi:arylsulfatase A-like enzyme
MTKQTRREFLKTMGIAAAGGLLPGCSGAAQRIVAGRRRPNIVFIITDDQRLSSFGFLGGKVLTPNIDGLAAEGVYCSRAYASTSVCTPSRYSCLTGRYASRCRHPNFANDISAEGQTRVTWNTHLLESMPNLPKVLQKSGYVTGAVGKWHLGGPNLKPIALESDPADPAVAKTLKANQARLCEHVRKQGFDYAASMHLQNLKNNPCRALGQHNIEWTLKGALDFIEQNKDRPFYLYMATTLLHGPDPLVSLKSDPRITEAGLLREPLKVQPSRQSVLDRVRAAGLAERAAPATWLDDGVGAVLKRLDELGLGEDTAVFYFNDHGTEGGKGSLYEGGVRTPTIIRWRGVVRPHRCDELIQNVDFAPTILDACGIEAPKEMTLDGLSLIGLLTGRKKKLRDSLYFEIGHTRAVCTKRWKYLAFRVPLSRHKSKEERIRMLENYRSRKQQKDALEESFAPDPEARTTHLGMIPGGVGTERGNALTHYKGHYYDADQLYDLENDPTEQNNLALEPAYEQKLGQMKALLKEYLAGLPGTFAEFKTK